MRVDKIRKNKKLPTNVIDFNLKKLDVKYNNNNSPFNDESWIIKDNTTDHENILINKLVSENRFSHYLPILKDIRFLVQNELINYSQGTINTHIRRIKPFFEFLEIKEIDIYSFQDIGYDLLLHYMDFLKTKQNAKSKKRSILWVLKKMSSLENIVVNEDIIKGNIPNVDFQENNKANNVYTKDEFDGISKTIVSIIKEYFSNNNVDQQDFVRASYWFLALCTGLNKTALNNLSLNDFEVLKEDEINKTYVITGIKNRAKNRIQQQTITIKKSKDHLLEKVLDELKTIHSNLEKLNLQDNYMFYHQKQRTYIRENKKNVFLYDTFMIYKGHSSFLTESVIYEKYASLFNIKDVILSTMKIRNHWSVEFFEKTNSELAVSQMLGHSSVDTTKNHYIKNAMTKENETKFNLFQELIHIFSKDNNFNDWVEFQKRLNIKEDNIDTLINKIKDGHFDTSTGKCIKAVDKHCQSYLQCFNCQHYSIVGDKDLWKVMSFREALIEVKNESKNYNETYLPIIEKINDILTTFDKSEIIKARNLLRKSRHPFWKNNIMIRTIADNFERVQE